MPDSPTAWIARRAESLLSLALLPHDDGSYRLVTKRADETLRHGGALIRTLSRHATEADALRRAAQWVRSYESYGFAVSPAEGEELVAIKRVALYRLASTAQTDLQVHGHWSYRGDVHLDIFVASDGLGGYYLRIEDPGAPPRLMIAYPDLAGAVRAARTWMDNPEHDVGMSFTPMVEPPALPDDRG